MSEYTSEFPFRKASLDAPITVVEGLEVSIITLTTDTLPEGEYLLSVSMVSQYTTRNDRLSWRVDGSFPSPAFLNEAKDALEVIPQEFTFPVSWVGGPIEMELLAQIDGAGQADVVIQVANIYAHRIA